MFLVNRIVYFPGGIFYRVSQHVKHLYTWLACYFRRDRYQPYKYHIDRIFDKETCVSIQIIRGSRGKSICVARVKQCSSVRDYCIPVGDAAKATRMVLNAPYTTVVKFLSGYNTFS